MTVPPRPSAASPSTVAAAVPAPRSGPAGPGASARGGESPGDVAGLAWVVREVTHVPGVLRLRQGRLSFESTRRVLFDGTPAELEIDVGRSPRAGLRVTVGSERLRVRVVRPRGAVAPCRELVERAAGGRPDTCGENDAWTVWRPLLAPEPSNAVRASTRVRRAFALPRAAGPPSRACPS